MSDQFTFSGPTTFVNRPKSVVLQNFQNSYVPLGESVVADINSRVKELVALSLDSKSLSDESKDEVVKALHDLAAMIERDGKPSISSKGILGSIRSILEQAADIADPAVKIFESIAPLFA
jgi:hypothetical protein